MNTVPIGTCSTDRYRRPVAEIQQFGKSKMVYTVITNINQIGKALHIPSDYITKYISIHKGATF
jgi:hypothetical protein